MARPIEGADKCGRASIGFNLVSPISSSTEVMEIKFPPKCRGSCPEVFLNRCS